MKSTPRRHSEIEQWVRTLVLRYNYLPLAYKANLYRLFDQKAQICKDIDCIKKRAVYILTADTDEAEQYRQAIYRTLALHGFAYEQDMYVLGSITSRVLRSATTIEKEVERIRDIITSERFRRGGYKLAAKLVTDLVVLNFGYVPPHYTYDVVVPGIKQPIVMKIKPIGATILSLALTQKLPVYSTKDSILDPVEAEKLVDFAISIRQYAVKTVLEERPRKITALYALLCTYIENEAKSRDLKVVEQLARWGALIESVIVPYYLHHYGFLKIDMASLMLFELRYL